MKTNLLGMLSGGVTPTPATGFVVERGRMVRAWRASEERSNVEAESAEGKGARRKKEER